MSCSLVIFALFALTALIVAVKMRDRVSQQLREQERKLEWMNDRIHELAREVRVLRGEAGAVPAEEEGPAEPIRAAATAADARPVTAPAVQPEVAAVPVIPVPEPEPPIPAIEAVPAIPPPELPLGVEPSVAGPPPLPLEAEPAPGPPPEPPSEPPAEPSPAGGWNFDWESLVGVKLFSALAGIALTLAAIFFLKYSIDQGWLQPPVRVAIGILVSVSLLITCELKAARRYRVTADAMDAAALAILFATFYAAHALWGLVGTGAALFLLAIVTTLAVLLSVRRESLFIALLGLASGFSSPALLAAREDNPVGLFGYLLILCAGLGWVAGRMRWTSLSVLSVILTTLYQWGWVTARLGVDRLPLAFGIFLAFPIVGLAVAMLAARDGDGADGTSDAPVEQFRQIAALASTLPLLFGVYVASVPEFGARFHLLFGYQLVLAGGLLALAIARRLDGLHALGAVATLLVVLTWLVTSYTVQAWPAVLLYVAAFVLLFLLAPRVARRFGFEFTWIGIHASHAAPLLLVSFPVLILREPATESPALTFGTLFLLLALVSWTAVREGRGALHFSGAFFALLAQAAWAAQHLTPDRLLSGLGVFLAFGLFYVGVPVVARRAGRPLTPGVLSGAFILLAQVSLLFFTGEVAPHALWALALLLAVLTIGAFVEAVSSGRPGLALVSGVMSFLVLGAWWAAGPVVVTGELVPALAVVALLAMGVMAGAIWSRSRAAEGQGPAFGHAAALGLIGHLFLMFTAAQPTLAVPPWPLAGVLLVLNLAAGAAALYLRSAVIHVSATAASGLVLHVWLVAVPGAPWPPMAVIGAALLVAFTMLWIGLAERARLDEGGFAAAAAVAVFFGHTVALAAGDTPGALPLWVAVGAHGLLTLVLLHLAGDRLERRVWPWLPMGTVVLTVAAAAAWHDAHRGASAWWEPAVVAGVPYLALLGWPLVLGQRGARFRPPFYAAVAASAGFFVVGKVVLQTGGFDHVLGALPVGQALALLPLLALARRTRPGEARDVGRLAFVAGAVLAFVTVAIPLQLENAWLTVGWALEAAALTWLYRRLAHRGLLAASAALFAVVFVRLAVNPEVFLYEPHGARIFNWYLYTYLTAAVAMLAGARLLRPTDDRLLGISTTAWLPAAATILLFLLLNIEIADYYTTGPAVTFNLGASLAQDLTYTIGWALFAIALLVAGIVQRSRAARVAALALLTVTALKGFLHDLARLGGLYRVASFVGLAVSLALVALLLQRFVLGSRRDEQP